MSQYKAHLFASLGNGKLHPSRMACGRHLHRNSRGTHAVKPAAFMQLANEDINSVCAICYEIQINIQSKTKKQAV